MLGTDGFGRSDFRSKLREHFEVNRHYIVVAALKALADEGTVPAAKVGRGDHEVRHQGRQDQPAVRLKQQRSTETSTWHRWKCKVPDIGDFKEVAVIELLVKPGDTVKAEQSLITVETDKASMEIPSIAAGVVKEMKVKLGDKVNEGSLVLLLDGRRGAAARRPRRQRPRRQRRRCGTGRSCRGAAAGTAAGGAAERASCPTSATSRTSR